MQPDRPHRVVGRAREPLTASERESLRQMKRPADGQAGRQAGAMLYVAKMEREKVMQAVTMRNGAT